MTPMIRGMTGSNSSEGSNKCFSSKERIPNLNTSSLVTNNTPKSEATGHSQGEEIQSHIRET